MGKAIMEMRDKKATGDNNVPADVLKLLGEDGHRIVTQLINNIQSVPGGKDLTSGECSLGQTIPI